MIEPALVWLVMGPLLGAVLAYLAGPRLGGMVTLVAALSVTAAASVCIAGLWEAGQPLRYGIGGWDAPLGIALYLDGLSAFFLAMTAAVGLPVTIYAMGYFPPPQGTGVGGERAGRPRRSARPGARRGRTAAAPAAWSERESFWPLWLMLWGAMNAVLLSADLFNVYVGLEVITLAAVALVTLSGHAVALTAAMRYLLATLLGSMVYLLGVVLVYATAGSLDMHLLTGERDAGAGVPTWIAMGLMTAGLLIKTAIFPMHFWLPGAHASAPAPVSAVLSAVVVKVSFFLILRLWFGPMEPTVTFAAAQGLGVLGAAAVLWGSLQALRQRRLKMLIAYSTVAQLGYLMLVIPLTLARTGRTITAGAGAYNFDAWSGGMYQVLGHALAKAAMFMAAGAILQSLGHDRIVGMRGVVARMPLTAFAFGLAGVTLIGLPPSAGFIAKYFLLNASIESGQWWWGLVLLLGGLLAAMYVFRFFLHAFLPVPEERKFEEASPLLTLPALALALAALLLGLRAAEPFALLQMGAPFMLEGVPPGGDERGEAGR